MRIVILAGIAAAALTACSDGSSESDYEQCVQQAAQSPTAAGVNAALASCTQRFRRNKLVEQKSASRDAQGTVAKAYWDGWTFQRGSLPDALRGKGYKIYSVARFGVQVCEVAVPAEMGKVLFDESGAFREGEALNDNLVKVCEPQ